MIARENIRLSLSVRLRRDMYSRRDTASIMEEADRNYQEIFTMAVQEVWRMKTVKSSLFRSPVVKGV